jgi:hypothetical protein
MTEIKCLDPIGQEVANTGIAARPAGTSGIQCSGYRRQSKNPLLSALLEIARKHYAALGVAFLAVF